MATTTEVLQSALEAEAKGVPVNWRDLAFKINAAAMEQVAALQQEQEKDDGSENERHAPPLGR